MSSLDLTQAGTGVCPCRKDIEAKLVERFKRQEPAARDHKACLLGYGVNFTTGQQSQAAQIEYIATFPLKKGGERTRTIKGNMVFNYCPFCGGEGAMTMTLPQSLRHLERKLTESQDFRTKFRMRIEAMQMGYRWPDDPHEQYSMHCHLRRLRTEQRMREVGRAMLGQLSSYRREQRQTYWEERRKC